eukprot:scaffold731_cov261-Pinguiococcus_pyrenoidosus.AAC.100
MLPRPLRASAAPTKPSRACVVESRLVAVQVTQQQLQPIGFRLLQRVESALLAAASELSDTATDDIFLLLQSLPKGDVLEDVDVDVMLEESLAALRHRGRNVASHEVLHDILHRDQRITSTVLREEPRHLSIVLLRGLGHGDAKCQGGQSETGKAVARMRRAWQDRRRLGTPVRSLVRR